MFLDLVPFSDRLENEFGRSVSIRELVERSGLELRAGNPDELYGHPEFDSRAVLANQARYLVGRKHSTLVQSLVLEKPGAPRNP